jgi:hypothetical protein
VRGRAPSRNCEFGCACCFCLALVLFWSCFGFVLALFWCCFGVVWVLFLSVSCVLGCFRARLARASGVFQGVVLVLRVPCFGLVWSCFGLVLALFWDTFFVTGLVLGYVFLSFLRLSGGRRFCVFRGRSGLFRASQAGACGMPLLPLPCEGPIRSPSLGPSIAGEATAPSAGHSQSRDRTRRSKPTARASPRAS